MTNYEYYKGRGICVRCKKEKALKGLVHCLVCNMDTRLYSSIYYENLDEEVKVKKINKNKRKRELLIAFGVCVRCMKNDSHDGKTMCLKCKTYVNNKEKQKRLNNTESVSRFDRSRYNMCYVCGEPVTDGYRVCEKHLNLMHSIQSLRHTKNNTENHIWRRV